MFAESHIRTVANAAFEAKRRKISRNTFDAYWEYVLHPDKGWVDFHLRKFPGASEIQDVDRPRPQNADGRSPSQSRGDVCQRRRVHCNDPSGSMSHIRDLWREAQAVLTDQFSTESILKGEQNEDQASQVRANS